MQIAENKNQRFAQTSARKFVQNDEPYETGRAPPARPVFSFSPIPHFLLDSAPYRDSPRISRNPPEPRISHLITTPPPQSSHLTPASQPLSQLNHAPLRRFTTHLRPKNFCDIMEVIPSRTPAAHLTPYQPSTTLPRSTLLNQLACDAWPVHHQLQPWA